MTTDRELLQSYVQEGSEEAFKEFVRRHVNLVYGAALRQLCGNVALAQDVTQMVFTALAAKAAALSKTSHVSAWLYTTTRFTVSHTVRTERRRQNREQKAQSMHAVLANFEPHDILEVPPKLIDEVLERLDEGDREAILLRFLEGQSFAAIGVAMDASEDAVRMRVTRALEKIRIIFAKNGITSSAAAVGAVLANQAIAAPVNLAASVSMGALAGAATTSAKFGIITLMTTTKSTVLLAGATAIFALGYSGFQYREAQIRRDEAVKLTQERNSLQDALKQSEQQSVKFNQRAAQAEQQIAELQHKLDGLLAPKRIAVTKLSPAKASETGTAKEKMAEMKPLLEGGMPIKGAIIVLVGGKAVQRHVEFVMGKETRIDGGDDGTYAVTPTLNQDGSVKYAMMLLKKDADSGQERTVNLPSVIQTPWGGFTLSSGSGKVMAFDPDKSGP